MAIGWLTVLKALPWGTILSQAPTVVDAANRLLSQTRRRPSDEAPSGLDALHERIEALEEHDKADAAVMKQLAEEVAVLAQASQVMAIRMRLILALSVAGIAIGCVALAIVILR
ncbi:MAG TPA: hypothetical protein VFY80_05730 [Burkholderiales bacterium]|nr:hypothetical protein [Burkholderiales bacterium]